MASVAERPMAAPQVAPRAPALCMVTHGLRSCVVRPRLSSTRAIYSSLNGQKVGHSRGEFGKKMSFRWTVSREIFTLPSTYKPH